MRGVLFSISAFALAVAQAAPVFADENAPPPCEISGSDDVEGAVSAAADIHVIHLGLDKEPTMEGRYRLALAATSKSDEAAPDTVNVRVVQMKEGTPSLGGLGFRTLVIETPGIAGKGNKGNQPTVAILSGRTQLGSRTISPKGDVLFPTSKAGVSPVTIEQMDLEKRLSRPSMGLEITIVLNNSAGVEMARYALPAATMQSLNDTLAKGYGMVWTAAEQGKCKPNVAVSGYV